MLTGASKNKEREKEKWRIEDWVTEKEAGEKEAVVRKLTVLVSWHPVNVDGKQAKD